ncbi:hypothetical protein BDY24DRAFT_76778 [Mrakia frigida]|uniref:uncharacterized protein n=1 Tax=Mrakia frigida TaxID=29902 RepID=UPI003FCBF331
MERDGAQEELEQSRRRQEEEEGMYESEVEGNDDGCSPVDSTTAPPFHQQQYYPHQHHPHHQQVFAQLPYDNVHPQHLPQYTSYPPNHYPNPTPLPYHPSTHYPPAPNVPARFDIPRRPTSALGSISPHKARPQMTMPGFSPQRRSSFPSRGRDDGPLLGMPRGVEDDGAAALLMALRANGSSPVKPSMLEYEAESEEEEEDASPPKEVWTSEMDVGRYETSMKVKEEDRSSPIKYEEPSFDYSRTFKEEEDHYDEEEEEEEREMERRKLERQTLFPVVPKPLPGMTRRSRQPSLVGPPKDSPSSSTTEPLNPKSRAASSAFSPSAPTNPLSASQETNLESSPAFGSTRTNDDEFLQSSPPSPGMIGRSPPTNDGRLLSSPGDLLTDDASSRFSQVRSKPVPMGTPTPSARSMGGGKGVGSSSSRPSIPGLRWGEDAKRSMEVAFEGKGRGRRVGIGFGGGSAGSGSGTPSRLWGASSSSSSRRVQDRRKDEGGSDEEDEDEPEDSKPFTLTASSPSSSPNNGPTGPISSSSKRDSPLEPLFIPPQIPHRRPSSSAPLTSLISSQAGTATLLPIFHPTPFKPSIPLGMTSIQSYTSNVSSTRTPFKSSSSTSSSHGHPSSTPSNNSTLFNSTNGGIPSSQASHQRYSSNARTTTTTTATTQLGSSPPASSFFQLSSPQSLSLTRSLGLAPATPGNGSGMWGVATTPDGNGGQQASGRKRKGSWAVASVEEREGEGKRVKGTEEKSKGSRDSGFFEGREGEEGGKE